MKEFVWEAEDYWDRFHFRIEFNSLLLFIPYEKKGCVSGSCEMRWASHLVLGASALSNRLERDLNLWAIDTGRFSAARTTNNLDSETCNTY